MTTALIVICIVFSVAIILGAVSHFLVGIKLDKTFRERMARYRFVRGTRRRQAQDIGR